MIFAVEYAGVLVVLLWDPIPTLHTEYSTKQSNLILQKLPHLYIIQERRMVTLEEFVKDMRAKKRIF